jgi:hypothetical protein
MIKIFMRLVGQGRAHRVDVKKEMKISFSFIFIYHIKVTRQGLSDTTIYTRDDRVYFYYTILSVNLHKAVSSLWL